MNAHAPDWPVPGRLWEGFVFLILVAVLSIVAREAFGAEPRGQREAPAPGARGASVLADSVAPHRSAVAPADDVAALFDDVAKAEDPALADHVAAGSLTAGELALVIIFIILLFPVGIILLIIFLVDDD